MIDTPEPLPERLRAVFTDALLEEAAAEIERLQTENDELHAALQKIEQSPDSGYMHNIARAILGRKR